MTKPVTGLNTFAGVAPPWSLSQLDADFSALQAAINDLGTYANPLTDSSGTPNTVTVNSTAGLTAAYGFGLLLYIKIANTNTSTAVTINLNSLGNVNVVTPDGSGPPVGAFVAAGVYGFIHDGTNFQALYSSVSSLLAANNTWTGNNTFSPASGTPITVNTVGQNGIDIVAALNTSAILQLTATASAQAYIGAVGLATQLVADSQLYDIVVRNDTGTAVRVAFGSTNTSFLINTTSMSFRGPIAAALVDMTPDKSSWTTTLSGGWLTGSNPTGTLKWERQGTQVTIWCDTAITQTASNFSTISASALPAAITPSSNRFVTCGALESGTVGAQAGGALVLASGSITIGLLLSGTYGSNFTNSGTAGIQAGWSITYSL